jgi:hypothetical protein
MPPRNYLFRGFTGSYYGYECLHKDEEGRLPRCAGVVIFARVKSMLPDHAPIYIGRTESIYDAFNGGQIWREAKSLYDVTVFYFSAQSDPWKRNFEWADLLASYRPIMNTHYGEADVTPPPRWDDTHRPILKPPPPGFSIPSSWVDEK